MNAPEHRVRTAEAAPAASPASSRRCVIYAKSAGSHYGWGWTHGDRHSKGFFRYFYECVQDARKHGFSVDFAEVADALKAARSDA